PNELSTLNNLAVSLAETGRFAAALEPLHEAYRLRASSPEVRGTALFLEASLGDVLRCVGEFRESLAWLDRARPVIAEHAPGFMVGVHNQQALTWLHLGQHARAYRELQDALAIDGAPPAFQAKTHLLLARYAMALAQQSGVGGGVGGGGGGGGVGDAGSSGLGGSGGAAARKALGAARALSSSSARYATHAQAELLAARFDEPEAAYRAATAVVLEAGSRQMQGVRMAGLGCAARSALACGHTAVAVGHAIEALALWPEHVPDDFYVGEVWLAAATCLDAAHDPRLAGVLEHAIGWIGSTARDHVPEEFRDSFLNRNAANRELIAMAVRHRIERAAPLPIGPP
ncbi:MAG: tetratricopeptide repeat protein, partial [Caldimonas sp.]